MFVIQYEEWVGTLLHCYPLQVLCLQFIACNHFQRGKAKMKCKQFREVSGKGMYRMCSGSEVRPNRYQPPSTTHLPYSWTL